jgi:hypothetical protein
MATRLYFLVPDVGQAREIVRELLLARIEERHIHIVAREGTPLEELPEAGLFQSSDIVKAAERGVTAGGATGLLAGLVAVAFPPAGLVMGGGAVLISTLAGAGIGAWAATLIGASLPNTELERYERAVAEGQILMLIDVPKERAQEIGELVRRHHPDATIADTDPERTVAP